MGEIPIGFALQIYRITKSFPDDERFGLIAQIRRSAASVPTNIAEGCGRYGEKELARFLSIAAGSASETEYHILLAYDLGYIQADNFGMLQENICEIKRMLYAFIKKKTADG